jgi:hypothetical protein
MWYLRLARLQPCRLLSQLALPDQCSEEGNLAIQLAVEHFTAGTRAHHLSASMIFQLLAGGKGMRV